MTPVDQTTFGNPGGNCFSACVASLLGLAIEDVPYFMGEPDELGHLWTGRLDAWLEPRGLYALHFDILDRERYDRANLWPKGFYILGGMSPRGAHAVVAQGKNVVHDPHPNREGLLSVDGFTLILAIDFARVPVPLVPASPDTKLDALVHAEPMHAASAFMGVDWAFPTEALAYLLDERDARVTRDVVDAVMLRLSGPGGGS